MKLLSVGPVHYFFRLRWVAIRRQIEKRLSGGHMWRKAVVPSLPRLMRPTVGWLRPLEVPPINVLIQNVGSDADANETLPQLRHSVIRGKNDPPREAVSRLTNLLPEALEDLCVLVAVCEAVDVLHEIRHWSSAAKDANVLIQQRGARIGTSTLVFEPVPRLRERRAWGPTVYQRRLSNIQPRVSQKLVDVECGDVAERGVRDKIREEDLAIREHSLPRCLIPLDGGDGSEAGSLTAKI